MIIRDETSSDIAAIQSVVATAFKDEPHASGQEAAIVDALRNCDALALSLVADAGGQVVGYVAFSPVLIGGNQVDWLGLGPIAVISHMQRRGIGKALIEAGLERIKAFGARGCVVLGEPAYYGRFGFANDANLRFPGAPEEYFQRVSFQGQVPSGVVDYHPAFYRT